MGLAEKQAIRDVTEKDLPAYQAIITKNGLTATLQIDWETLPPTGTDAVEKAGYAAREFRDALPSLAQDSLAKDEFNKQIKTIKIRHDASFTDDNSFKMKIDGDVLVFMANLNLFIVSTSGQKSFKAAMIEVL